jgi:hypothetical protein
MTLFKKPLLLAALTTVLFAFAAQPAGALTFVLDTGNVGLTGTSTGPYGEVVVTRTSATSATIAMTAYSDAAYAYLFGDGGSIGLNVNNGGGTTGLSYSGVTGITQPQLGASTPIFTQDSGNVDGWGSYNFVLDNFDGFGYSFKTLTFTLNATGTNWLSDADVLTANTDGHSLVSHIFIVNTDYTNTTTCPPGGGCTGYATSTGVPDGGMTISLLGMALGGLGLVARRKN